MEPTSRLPLFSLGLLGFLAVLVILAVAVFFLLKSRREGTTQLSGPAGCAVGCALLALAGLAGAATLLVIVLNLPNELVRHGPIESIRFEFDEAPPAPEPPAEPHGELPEGETTEVAAIHATIELRPGADPGAIARLLRRHVHGGLDWTVRTIERDGEQRSAIEIHAPLDEEVQSELSEFLRQLREDPEGFELPKGLVIEIRD